MRGGEVRGGVLCVYVCPSITWGSRELRDSSSVGTSNGMWGLRRGPWGWEYEGWEHGSMKEWEDGGMEKWDYGELGWVLYSTG